MIIEVFVYPDNESLSILVSLEFLYGIWSEFVVRACTTLPKHDKDKFIFLASYKVWPFTPLFLTFSDPAKSMKHSLHLC